MVLCEWHGDIHREYSEKTLCCFLVHNNLLNLAFIAPSTYSEGAAEGASCENELDCAYPMCAGGKCAAPIIAYPPGTPCNFDIDCESGDCRNLGLASFCWGADRDYKIDLYDYKVSSSGTPSIDIYIVKNDEYAQSKTYQKKIVNGPVSYYGGSKSEQCLPPAWMAVNTCMCGTLWPCVPQPQEDKSRSMWRSSKWTCGDEAFHGSDWGYSVIVCNNSGDGLYIDRLEIMKNPPVYGTAKHFGAHGTSFLMICY